MTALYVFGSNDMYQIALPSDVDSTSTPTRLSFFNDKKVIKVACGKLHVLALCEDGHLYSWGVNDDGALGRKGPEEVPGRVSFRGSIKDMCAGASFSAVLTSNGLVYVSGTFKSSSGILGLTPEYRKNNGFIQIKGINRIVKIFGSNNHIVMIDKAGWVWTVGANDSYQLGRKNRERKMKLSPLIPQPVAFTSKDKGSKYVTGSGGGFHSVVVNARGEAFSWGSNYNGELGIGTLLPTPVRMLVELEGVSSVACGSTFTLFLTKKQELYGAGENSSSQLAQDDEKIIPTPRLILSDVHRVAAGRDFSLALKGNDIYGWGLNMSGEVGVKEGIVSKPTKIDFDFGQVVDIKCGAEFSVVLTSDDA